MSEASPTRRILAASPPWIAFATYFLLSIVFFGTQHHLYDNDSYYHLAIARQIAETGVPDHLPQLRFSALAHGFGDKELLFHLLLAPLLRGGLDPIQAGQVALALFVAGLFSTIALFSRPLLGRWAYAVPFLVAPGSLETAWRLVRLRPELLSLLLLLWALRFAGTRRYYLLGITSVVYALSYTAFHAFVGVFAALFLFRWLVRGRFQPALFLFPMIGAGVGLLAHPNFPANLEIWILQTFDFFAAKSSLDVGTEIGPQTTAIALRVNLGWYLGIAAILAAAARRATDPNPSTAHRSTFKDPFDHWSGQADAFGVAAALFVPLWLLMSRFSLYAFSFSTLAIFFGLLTARRHLDWRRGIAGTRWPAWVLLPLTVAALVITGTPEWHRYQERNSVGPNQVRITDRQDWAAAVPVGAHVAARWQQTPIYMLWAPQGRYLNVLDPIFMARPFPAAFEAQRRLFLGEEPDPAMQLAAMLDSRFIAFGLGDPTGDLRQRLEADPRFVRRYSRINVLYELVTPGPRRFVVDWRLVPSEIDLPPSTTSAADHWPSYPRVVDEQFGKLEAFVDTRRLTRPASDTFCFAFGRPAEATTRRIELTSWAKTTVWQGHSNILELRDQPRAVLGRGTRFTLPGAEPGDWTTVLTCGARGEPAGFYWEELLTPASTS